MIIFSNIHLFLAEDLVLWADKLCLLLLMGAEDVSGADVSGLEDVTGAEDVPGAEDISVACGSTLVLDSTVTTSYNETVTINTKIKNLVYLAMHLPYILKQVASSRKYFTTNCTAIRVWRNFN